MARKVLAAQKLAASRSGLNEAILALLGLLLAFTFSLALSKHDQRRTMLVADSNAIGDFYTCTAFVRDDGVRKDLQSVVRSYVKHRLALAAERMDEKDVPKKLDEIQALHSEMQRLTEKAVKDGDGTPAAIPLINTFNGVTSSHAAHLAAGRDRMPASIVLLLCLAAVVSMVLVGMQQGAAVSDPLARPSCSPLW